MIQIKHIKEILLKGFQSHTDTRIDLSPGLNVVVGPSDSGKTAVIRSIRWGLYSEPSGDAFINPQIEKAMAALKFSDGSEIVRTRGKGENSYSVNGIDFKGFGTNIPEEVSLAHGMPKASFGEMETSLNISFQLDAPFMLSETPGAAAKVLGKLAGTEELDLAAKSVNSDLIKARTEKSNLEAQNEKTERALQDYMRVKEAEAKLQALEVVLAELNMKKERYQGLVKMDGRMQYFKIERENISIQLERFKNVNRCQAIVSCEEDKVEKVQRLQRTITSVTSINSGIIDNKIAIKGLKKIEKAAELETALSRAAGLVQWLSTHNSKYQEIDKASWIQKSILAKTKNFETGEKMLAAAASKNAAALVLKKHNENLNYYAGRVEGGEKYLEKFKNLIVAIKTLLCVDGNLVRLDFMEDCSNMYSDRSIKMRDTRLEISTHTGYEETAKEIFADYLKSLGKCPTCHSDIHETQINQIIGG